ncbi:restriction endonuclease [Mycobacterium sp. 852014-52144_SCH5372336]|uniref:restriction endonuclease n=1 Tax=Mycobacterium sp. 852014-52144_SCH5372336 TaxID=1834115 RepID=UPI0007FCE503|nr:restriction endonuclease [Mycobacterium sp. 852014-52144_SCH5372336]OBB74292.1 hypothetical protein A5759_13820 [Mycobacterium sp. 852014-52144_SCH5372336]
MPTTEKLPLSPMLFQYLVGLYHLKYGSTANYHVTLGDEVVDEASGTRRDVDVTVTTPDGVYGFAGFEVKHWKKKLDVSDVEALAAKLNDMPTLTRRAIVCSSGYYKPAIKKAAHHGIDLYVIKEWTTPIEEQFPNLAPMKGPPSKVFRGTQSYLTWPERNVYLHGIPGPYFEISWDTTLFDADGNKHAAYPDFSTFSDGMLLLSTDRLWHTKPMQDRLEPQLEAHERGEPLPEDDLRWPFGHTLDIESAKVYIRTADSELHHVTMVTIQGQLAWETSPWLYLAMEKVTTGEPFGSAMVAVSPVPGRMTAIMIPSEGRTLSIQQVVLNRDQLNILKQLQLASYPEGDSGPS